MKERFIKKNLVYEFVIIYQILKEPKILAIGKKPFKSIIDYIKNDFGIDSTESVYFFLKAPGLILQGRHQSLYKKMKLLKDQKIDKWILKQLLYDFPHLFEKSFYSDQSLVSR